MFEYYFLEDKTERDAYEQIASGIAQMLPEVVLERDFTGNITNVICAVLVDHPHLFWFEGRASVQENADRWIIRPCYEYDETERKRGEEEAARVLEFFDEVKNASDYEKAKAAYEWLLKNVLYSAGSSGQNIYNVFVERRAVCKGLSKAYQFLLSKMDVFSTLITGTIDGRSLHSWNIVEIDGAYYNVDVSLGFEQFDFLFKDAEKRDKYRMFLKSDEQFARTQKIIHSERPHLICENNFRGIKNENQKM